MPKCPHRRPCASIEVTNAPFNSRPAQISSISTYASCMYNRLRVAFCPALTSCILCLNVSCRHISVDICSFMLALQTRWWSVCLPRQHQRTFCPMFAFPAAPSLVVYRGEIPVSALLSFVSGPCSPSINFLLRQCFTVHQSSLSCFDSPCLRFQCVGTSVWTSSTSSAVYLC